ncbi:hypothetical protein EDB81DRAFT_468989 [Dactylonectria macrodidyma]|uniref:Uncharacterized protein n=1 Tax=Dactylonectria macrodidyma TaxID=307937 RepID=A0A9P9EZU9_9HYPO|nr:hypothetical protein EDB81DRAFT_468989 [Dactylonectria macrodidyma]
MAALAWKHRNQQPTGVESRERTARRFLEKAAVFGSDSLWMQINKSQERAAQCSQSSHAMQHTKCLKSESKTTTVIAVESPGKRHARERRSNSLTEGFAMIAPEVARNKAHSATPGRRLVCKLAPPEQTTHPSRPLHAAGCGGRRPSWVGFLAKPMKKGRDWLGETSQEARTEPWMDGDTTSKPCKSLCPWTPFFGSHDFVPRDHNVRVSYMASRTATPT